MKHRVDNGTSEQYFALAAKTLTATFDGVGFRTSVTYPGGRVITYVPDAVNRISQVKEGAASIADYSWAGQRVAKRVYPNGIRLEAFYDGAKRVTDWKNLDALGADKSTFGYAYDKAHNRKFEKRVHDAKGDVYRVDGIYELTGAKYGVPIADILPTKVYTDYLTFDREQTWEYDGVGNRKTMVDGAVTTEYNRPAGGGAYTPDPVNRIYRTRQSGVDTNFTSDANGNLTNDGIRTYTYNYRNEQIEVHAVSGGALVESANYNCFGLRIRKQTATATDYYLDGPRVVEEHDGSDAVTATYVFGDWIDEVLTMTRGGATYYYSQQALYSVAYISDASGNNIEKYQYDAFGKPSFFHWIPIPGGGGSWSAVTQSLIGNPFAFTGREYDTATSSYYYRATYMDPQHGRFTTRDPLTDDTLLNQHAFRSNRPTVWESKSRLISEGLGNRGSGSRGGSAIPPEAADPSMPMLRHLGQTVGEAIHLGDFMSPFSSEMALRAVTGVRSMAASVPAPNISFALFWHCPLDKDHNWTNSTAEQAVIDTAIRLLELAKEKCKRFERLQDAIEEGLEAERKDIRFYDGPLPGSGASVDALSFGNPTGLGVGLDIGLNRSHRVDYNMGDFCLVAAMIVHEGAHINGWSSSEDDPREAEFQFGLCTGCIARPKAGQKGMIVNPLGFVP